MEPRLFAILQILENERALIEKQIGKLEDIVKCAPALHQQELLAEPQPGIKFLIVPERQISELVSELKFKALTMKHGLEACLAPKGATVIDRFIGTDTEGE